MNPETYVFQGGQFQEFLLNLPSHSTVVPVPQQNPKKVSAQGDGTGITVLTVFCE